MSTDSEPIRPLIHCEVSFPFWTMSKVYYFSLNWSLGRFSLIVVISGVLSFPIACNWQLRQTVWVLVFCHKGLFTNYVIQNWRGPDPVTWSLPRPLIGQSTGGQNWMHQHNISCVGALHFDPWCTLNLLSGQHKSHHHFPGLSSYWCYNPHRLRDLMSPVCGIFITIEP